MYLCKLLNNASLSTHFCALILDTLVTSNVKTFELVVSNYNSSVHVCFLSLFIYTHDSFKFPVLKHMCVNSTMSFIVCPLCTSTGLHYHIRDVRFDNAVLGVEVHHGERLSLGGNTTRRRSRVDAVDFQLAEDGGME